jgi:hypothetical protein
MLTLVNNLFRCILEFALIYGIKISFFFFFVVLNSGPTPWATLPAFFLCGVLDFFEIGSRELFAWAGFEPLVPGYFIIFLFKKKFF